MKIIVLAGGKSTRFGSDKAFFTPEGHDGATFIEMIVKKLIPLQADILISINPSQERAMKQLFAGQSRVKFVIDHENLAEYGPLGGLYSAVHLDAADQTASYMIIPVDLPDIRTSDLALLAEAENVFIKTPLQSHYLLAHLPAFRAEIDTCIAKGEHRMRDLLEKLGTKPLHFPKEAERYFF